MPLDWDIAALIRPWRAAKMRTRLTPCAPTLPRTNVGLYARRAHGQRRSSGTLFYFKALSPPYRYTHGYRRTRLLVALGLSFPTTDSFHFEEVFQTPNTALTAVA